MKSDSITLVMPDSLGDWAQGHSATVDKVQVYLRKKGKAVQESELWHMIAEGVSSEWRDAKEILGHATSQLKEATSEHNMPLGAIGAALAGAELDIVVQAHDVANAKFIVIDESLRQEQGPKCLLEQGMKHVTALHLSAAAEKSTRAAAKQFRERTRPRGSLLNTLSEKFDGGKPSNAFGALNSIFRAALPKAKPAETAPKQREINKPISGFPGFSLN